MVDARKQRFGPDELRPLFGRATLVVIGKGQKSQSFHPRERSSELDAAVEAALGPSGNLRAPTLRLGDVYLVGFAPQAWKQTLGIG